MNRTRIVPLIIATAFLAGLFSPWRPTWNLQAQADGRYFPETGHWVRGVFLQYWTDHGGLAQQGYPLSEEFQQKSALDGKTHTVQYFERALFEKHPENTAPNFVLLAQLGTYDLKARLPNGSAATGTQPGPGVGSAPPFYDDRSGGLELLQSYYNAVDRKEYKRAYGYWEAGSFGTPGGPGAFDAFVQGYADTTTVTLQTGKLSGDAPTGHVYTNIPTVLVAKHTNGSTQTFAGCYTTLHTNPNIDPDPDALVERLVRGKLQLAPANSNPATLLATACQP